MSLSNEQIVDAVAEKSLMEVMELVKAIEEKFALQHPSYLIRFRKPGDLSSGRVDFHPIYLTGKPALDALCKIRQQYFGGDKT